KRREAAETRNQAEALVYQTEKLLRDQADKVSQDVRQEAEAAVAELKRTLEGEDTNAIREATERTATVGQKIGTAIYAQAQQSATSGGGPSGSAAGSSGDGGDRAHASDEEVVDAEIVDDDKGGDEKPGGGAG
ncbi:Hsp70 family protein, partial [Streptomyces sp. SID8361]